MPLKTLVRVAKMRWRIERDYRELKAGLGIDHFEEQPLKRLPPPPDPGHRGTAFHHQETARHAKSSSGGHSLYSVLKTLQHITVGMLERCLACQRPPPT